MANPPRPSARPLPPQVRALGLVSLLTDASSEMIYPLLPSFLVGPLRAGPAFVGLVEGAAEAVASISKLLSGAWSDRLSRRKPLVFAGYGLSSVVRPLIAIAQAPWHVLAIRVTDRIGKGVRGAPRDALIAEVTAPEERGRAYGFHRSMDHAGAVIGPLLAAALLGAGLDLRLVFAIAAIPGLLSLVAIAAGVDEPPRPAPETEPRAPAAARGALGGGLTRYLVVLALFTLGNSSDAFLLLRAQEAGVSLGALPLLWAFHHVVKSALGTAGGSWSDRIGRRRAIALGWLVYAVAYAGFAVVATPFGAWALFAVYGLYFSLTEGAERALLASLAAADTRGRAFGLFHAVTGAMLLPASVLTGALWQAWGPEVALGTGAALAGAAAFALLLAVPEPGGAA